jgi:GNAT superfamily N-acetyltransferase
LVGDCRRDGIKNVNRTTQKSSDSTQQEQPVPEVQIRLAEAGDATAVATVLHKSFVEFEALYTPRGFAATTPDAAQVLARMREGPVWLAFRNVEILGTVAAVLKGEWAYLRGMAVLPAARHLRVGARLLEHVERWARDQGCRRLFLSTTPFLDGAIRLYEKFGFRRAGEGTHDLFGTPLFTMEKDLPPMG